MATTEKEKKPVFVLRDRLGGQSQELKDMVKDQNKIRKLLDKALKGTGKTIPQLAKETELKSEVVMWHVMAMKRYGEVVEKGRSGDYLLYSLKEES